MPEETLGHAVELVVVRHDEVGVAGHDEPARVDPAAGEHVALAQQDGRVDDDAVADHGHGVVVENPARHELEGERLAFDDNRVPGVVPALVAHDEAHVLGEEVGELPLPLVAPLGSDHDSGGHVVASGSLAGAQI